MPSAMYRFSCNTEKDMDVITWLDGFSGRERTLIIKEALRLHMRESQQTTADKLERMENLLSKLFREIIALKGSGVAVAMQEPIDLPTETMTSETLQEITTAINKMLD